MIWRHRAEKSPARPIWLLTFTDLVALMLAFFVMLFATQKIEQRKWKSLVEALSQSLSPPVDEAARVPTADHNIARITSRRAADLGYLDNLLSSYLASEPGLKGVTIRRLDDRIALGLPASALFAPGTAQVTPGARRALFEIGGILRNIGNAVVVHGHADPDTVRAERFASNWELSLARAASVAGALREAGYRRDLRAIGYGDTRFLDLAPAPDRRTLYRLARRVDIVILAGRTAP